MFDDLNESNFLIYAMKCYISPHCIISEFENDIKRTKYIKRLIRKYKSSKVLNERLILNHIVLLDNVFGHEATVRILFFKLDDSEYNVLKSFLVYLNIMPDIVHGINGKNLRASEIATDLNILNILDQI